MSAVSISRISPWAVIPKRSSIGAAGFDLSAAEFVTIPSGGCGVVKTDLQICIPPSMYGRIASRSGLAINSMINVGGGVIDSDFRGNVSVILFNHGPTGFRVDRGDRIAQLIFEKIEIPVLVECSCEGPLFDRENKGFGSSGIK